jgi:beta-hydroxyacyl-ACP dehydratase FabZ
MQGDGVQMDIRAIQAVLPHRYPWLLVDHVDHVDHERIRARKLVSYNDPHLQGHFPGHPVMPGVLIIEAMAQTGALFALRQTGFDPDKQVLYFMGMDKAKFRKPVVPGDTLILEVVPLRKGSTVWKLRGQAKVGDTIVAEAEFIAAVRPK